jgi:beta-galactosidase
MNRYLIAFLLFCFSSGVLSSQEVEFLPTDWQDPSVFEKGQTAPHAFHVPYSSREAALKNDKASSGNFVLLNGKWKFKLVETVAEVPQVFWEPGFNVKGWDEITVPSNWQMEGYDHPKFRNIALTFETKPPHIPEYFNPVGCYKRTFNVPAGWKNKEVMLRFEGIKSASYIWVNGKRVGYNQGGFEPAEFNITPFIKAGRNDLSVQVIRFSDGSYLENQDMWRLSGIFRDVKLYALPKTYIHDFYVVTDLDADYRDAKLVVKTDIRNAGSAATSSTLEIDVLDNQGKSILSNGIQSMPVKAEGGEMKNVTVTTLIANPLKWSAEFPNLYTILFHLKDNNGRTLEAFTHRLGFREIEMKNNVLMVNGVPVKFNGVNSHMHHPEHGQAVPLETLWEDLVIMKQFNINCVRTCHYPPTPEYIEMADEIGMYIVDEVGVEAHDNEYLSEDPAWTEKYRDRSRKLVYRDRNHASVVMWSAGNESGSGFNIHEVIKTGLAIDPSRPYWMYGGNDFYIPFEHIVGPRYWIPYQVKALAEGKVLPPEDQRPSFMDEYLAATGNGLGGMDEYWELIWKYPRLTGGAIWDWISPGINTPRWVLPDISPAKNDGQIMGRPVFTEGRNGRGLEFSGHDDWVEFYRHPSLDITGNQLAVGFWVKPFEIPQPNTFIMKGSHQYGIRMDSPQSLEFYIHSGRRISVKAKVPENWYGNWHHVAGIYDGEKVVLYIDDKVVGEEKFSGNISNTPFPVCIGRDANTQDQGEYSGRMSKMVIDDVRIYDKAVSLSELKSGASGSVLALDFENDSRQGNFFAVGLGGRTYGIIWPDREIQPEIYQIKKSGQPVGFEMINAQKGVIKIINRHEFKNLSDLAATWELKANGKTLRQGQLAVDIPAQQSKEVVVPVGNLPATDEEMILLVSFSLKDKTSWADAGHEIAWEQFVLSESNRPAQQQATGKLAFSENESGVTVEGANFRYTFDRETGILRSMLVNGNEYLEAGPEFNVWRAPIANDIDPWGSQIFSQQNFTPGYGRSIDNQLRTLGMRDMTSEAEELSVVQVTDDEVQVKVSAFTHSSIPRSVRIWNYRFSSGFERNEVWTVKSDGTIQLEQEIIPHGPMPGMLQKAGLQFQLPKAFSNVEWYGRGPFETYPDRKTGAKVGIYKSNADEMYVPYIIPQEHGNRTDVRWLRVEDGQGRGMMISSDDLLNFSLHKYTTDNLDRAMYTYQLEEAPNTILNVDYEMTGVGGTAIRQLERYRVMPGVKKYKLMIKPF